MRHLFLLALAGCSGSSALVSDPSTDAGSEKTANGPVLTVHVRTTAAPFTQTDGFSGQTSRMTKQGIRSFRLLRSADDPSPVVVFDRGSGYVEAGYDGGDDTIVGTAPLASIPPGNYSLARIAVTHSRFNVTSTMHYAGALYPGEFDCVQALSDGAEIDGAVRARGWYRYVFTTSGQSFPQEGTNAPLPAQAATGGFTMKTNGGETFYEIDAHIVIPSGLQHDVTAVIEVNMDKAFRWKDEELPGYVDGVYDTTPVSFEPVQRFGANTYRVFLE